jgi:chromate transporter
MTEPSRRGPADDPQRRHPQPSSVVSGRVREVGALFVKLGVIGFGGPAAHIALMRDEVVNRRRWMDDREFLDWVGAVNLIPGPNSTELAIHLGHQRAGWRGLVTAGVAFIAPAVAIVGTLAWLYERHGTDPRVIDVRYGVLPVIIAIVAHALVGLGRTALADRSSVVVGVGACAAYLLGVHELVVLGVAGAAGAGWANRDRLRRGPTALLALPLLVLGVTQVSLWRLLAVFVEIGSVLYGSGYVLLAFLQRSLVDDLGWVTSKQLLDAVAVGQVTPGPVFTTATFLGWQVDGPAGAAVATVGIFIPSFLFVALLSRIVVWVRQRPTTRGFLTGVTVGSLGLMAGVLVELAGAAFVDVLTVLVGLVALAVLVRTKLNSAWLIAGGVLIGLGDAALA